MDAHVWIAERVRRSEARVPQVVLGAARHIHAGTGCGRRRHPARRGPDQSARRRGRTRSDGDGHHPVHGGGIWRAPQPGRVDRLCRAGRFSVEASAGLHRRSAAGGHAGVFVPARSVRQRRAPRRDPTGSGVQGLAGAADGNCSNRHAGQRDSRDRVVGTERRDDRGTGRWRIHCARGALGGPCERHLDEPRAFVRTRSGRRRLDRILGIRRRAVDRGSARCWRRPDPPWPRWRHDGPHGSGYLRFSYANSMPNLPEAVERINRVSPLWSPVVR